MKEFSKIEKAMEILGKSKTRYVISPFHREYGKETAFYELESYFYETYLQTFSEKIFRIVARFICFYSAYIDVEEFCQDAEPPPFEIPINENIRDIGLEKLSQIIEYIIIKSGTTLNIYFSDINSMIYISSAFDVAVFSENKEFLEDVKMVSNMEGLCVRYVSETD